MLHLALHDERYSALCWPVEIDELPAGRFLTHLVTEGGRTFEHKCTREPSRPWIYVTKECVDITDRMHEASRRLIAYAAGAE